SDPSNFYMPYILDLAHSGNTTGTARLLLGTNRVYETTNSGGAWTAKSTTNANGWTTTAVIDSLAAAPSDSNTVYAAAGGHLFATTNFTAATPTWTEHTPVPAPITGNGAIEYHQIIVDPTTT